MKNLNKFKPLAFVAMFSALCMSGMAVAETAYTVVSDDNAAFNYSEASLEEKRVRIAHPQGNRNDNTQAKVVDLKVTPSKSSYRVNERMSFMVEGPQDYYLYVFNIDPVSKKHVMLIPNANTKDHHLQANKRYNIPGTVDFYSDRPGTEQLVFVGTTQPLKLKRTDFQQMGEFSMADSKSIDQAIYTLDPNAIIVADPSQRNNRSNSGNKPKVVNLTIY